MKKTIRVWGTVSLMVFLAGCANSANPNDLSKSQPVKSAQTIKQEEVKPVDANESYLANALLTPDDLKAMALFANARPALPQMNGKLDETRQDYDFFVVNTWYDRKAESDLMDDAITKFPSAEASKQRLTDSAKGQEVIPVKIKVGDNQIAYFQPGADKTEPSTMVFRYSQGIYGIKIAMYVPKEQGLTSEYKSSLAEQAAQIAQLQYKRLDDELNRKIALSTNAAISKLPTAISGTTLMGTVTVSDQQWLGIEHEFKQESIPGFVSGGMSRFSITARPKEVVDVTVMEFKTAEQAKKFAEELVPFAKKQEGKVLTLSKLLKDKNAEAVSEPFGVVELQAAPDNFLIDVSISSPFDQINTEAAEKDLKVFAEEILVKF